MLVLNVVDHPDILPGVIWTRHHLVVCELEKQVLCDVGLQIYFVLNTAQILGFLFQLFALLLFQGLIPAPSVSFTNLNFLLRIALVIVHYCINVSILGTFERFVTFGTPLGLKLA